MYDFLYTKAAVIHTWYGFCIHFISLLGTATTFMLFQLSINSRGNGYSRVDVIISYVLLVGALVLEIISVCRALLSTWTCSLLHRRGRGWEWPLHVITSLGQRVHPASRRLWSGSIGQYNLFHLCTRNTNEIGSRLAMKLGLQDWWNKMHFSGTFSQFALVWAECGASSSFIFCLKSISPFLEKMTQALPHCLQFQFAGIPSMPIQLKLILLVNMFDNIKDLKQVSIFILAGFTSRTSTCLYSELHLKAVLFEFRNVQLNFVS